MATPRPPRHRPRDSVRAALENRLRLAITSRRAFQYLALATAALTVLIGFLMTLIDRRDFPTLGDGLWWAVQTLSTVGYGDIVPHSAWGRLLGTLVIIMGVTFLAFLTASVTSMFITAERERREQKDDLLRDEADGATTAALARIEGRLAAIEARLSERGDA